MQATTGDHLHVHSRTTQQTDRTGVIIEVRGPNGSPPYWVRFDDGHEGLMFPGGDCVIGPPRPREGD